MASSMIIFYKLDVVITTIQKISSKTFKTFHIEKTCYRLVESFWEIEIETLFTLLFDNCIFVWLVNICQFPRNVLLELKLFKIDKAFAI